MIDTNISQNTIDSVFEELENYGLHFGNYFEQIVFEVITHDSIKKVITGAAPGDIGDYLNDRIIEYDVMEATWTINNLIESVIKLIITKQKLLDGGFL